MYLEFLLLIGDYFRTLKRKYFLYEWVLPLCLCAVMFRLLDDCTTVPLAVIFVDFAKEFSETSVSLLGILVGFSITVITVLNTTNTPNIEAIKKIPTEFFIGKQKLFLFHLLLINLTYSVVMEILNLIFNLCFPWILEKTSLAFLRVLLCVDLFFILHILLLNLRNMADFYFILFKENSSHKNKK
jgi:hypothetical protein